MRSHKLRVVQGRKIVNSDHRKLVGHQRMNQWFRHFQSLFSSSPIKEQPTPRDVKDLNFQIRPQKQPYLVNAYGYLLRVPESRTDKAPTHYLRVRRFHRDRPDDVLVGISAKLKFVDKLLQNERRWDDQIVWQRLISTPYTHVVHLGYIFDRVDHTLLYLAVNVAHDTCSSDAIAYETGLFLYKEMMMQSFVDRKLLVIIPGHSRAAVYWHEALFVACKSFLVGLARVDRRELGEHRERKTDP